MSKRYSPGLNGKKAKISLRVKNAGVIFLLLICMAGIWGLSPAKAVNARWQYTLPTDNQPYTSLTADQPGNISAFAIYYPEMFVFDGANKLLYKSTNGGSTWGSTGTVVGTKDTLITRLVCSPYYLTDGTLLATDGTNLYKSGNMGASWSSVTQSSARTGSITSIALANAATLLVGYSDGHNGGGIAMGSPGTWKDTWTKGSGMDGGWGGGDVYAVAFSPNYTTDRLIMVVSAYASEISLRTKIYLNNWDTDLVKTTFNNATGSNLAGIAVPVDYVPNGRTPIFVGLGRSSTSPAPGGCDAYRVDPGASSSTFYDLNVAGSGTSLNVNSIAFSNTTLAVSQYGSGKIYHSDDVSSSVPTWYINTDGPTGTNAQLTFSTATSRLYAATASPESELAYSTDCLKFYETLRIKGPSQIALTSSLNPSNFGQSVTFTATVSAVPPGSIMPAGTVTFKDGPNTLGTINLDTAGKATYSTSTLTATNHNISAAYNGDNNYDGSTSSTLIQVVTVKASSNTAVTSSANPSVYGQSVTFNVTVSAATGIPTGTVTFKDGTNTLGTPVTINTAGKASYSTSALTLGSHSISAVYSGDSNYNGSTSSSFTQTVNKASTTTTATSAPSTSTSGQAVTFTATVKAVSPASGIPTGNVTFQDGANIIGNPVVLDTAGKATYKTSALAVGSHSISAVYSGDNNYYGSTSSTITHTVNKKTSGGGGGGGGGGGVPLDAIVSTDIVGNRPVLRMNTSGMVTQGFTADSADKKITISLPIGVYALVNGKPISFFSIKSGVSPADAPRGHKIISSTYECEPGGAAFNPPLTFTYNFAESEVTAGIEKKDLYLAFYDVQAGQWVPISGVVETASNTLTVALSHFTSLAVFAPAPADFTLSGLEISPTSVSAGAKVSVGVTVNNTGGKAGTYAVVLKINNATDQSKSVTIDAGGSQKVSFDVSRKDPGNYSVKMGELSGSFTVTMPASEAAPAPSTPPAPEAAPAPAPTPAASPLPTPIRPSVPSADASPVPVPTLPSGPAAVSADAAGSAPAATSPPPAPSTTSATSASAGWNSLDFIIFILFLIGAVALFLLINSLVQKILHVFK